MPPYFPLPYQFVWRVTPASESLILRKKKRVGLMGDVETRCHVVILIMYKYIMFAYKNIIYEKIVLCDKEFLQLIGSASQIS